MDTTRDTLLIMVPVDIDDTTLTSTTAPEDDYPAWLGTTTYSAGDRVIKSHRVYESGLSSNLNRDPDDINTRVGTLWWIDVSATNAWRIFDGQSSSTTVASSPFTIVLRPGFISSVYAGGIKNTDQVDVTYRDSPGGAIVFSKTIVMEDSLPPDYYEYIFSPFRQKPDLVIDDIPPFALGELTVTFTASSGNIEVGMCRVGDFMPMGTTQAGAEVTPKTYSRIKIDEFGNNEIVRRRSARDMSLDSYVPVMEADSVLDILERLQDIPTICVATRSDNHAAARVFGLVNGKIRYVTDRHAFLSVTIQGLI